MQQSFHRRHKITTGSNFPAPEVQGDVAENDGRLCPVLSSSSDSRPLCLENSTQQDDRIMSQQQSEISGSLESFPERLEFYRGSAKSKQKDKEDRSR